VCGIYAVLIIAVMGKRPLYKEWLGAGVTTAGCVLMLLDPKAERQ